MSWGPCQFPTLGFVVARYVRAQGNGHCFGVPYHNRIAGRVWLCGIVLRSGWALHAKMQVHSKEGLHTGEFLGHKLDIQARCAQNPVWRYRAVLRCVDCAMIRSSSGEDVAKFSWSRKRVYDHTIATVLYEMTCLATTFTVTDMRGYDRTRTKPLPLTTVCMPCRRCCCSISQARAPPPPPPTHCQPG